MKYCFTDFIFTVFDYFSIIKKREIVFEWIIPLLVALIVYFWGKNNINSEFKKDILTTFIPMLTNIFAILVGFTITAIAIFTTSTDKNEILDRESDREILGKKINYFRFVYANLIFSSIAGLSMLIITISSFFLLPTCLIKKELILAILIFGTLLNILLAIRNTTNLYFIFFRRR